MAPLIQTSRYFSYVNAKQKTNVDTCTLQMGLLQLTITWYRVRRVGEQASHWDIQNKENSSLKSL